MVEVVTTGPAPAGYRLENGPPSAGDYLTLRARSGLSRRRRDQVAAGLDGAWAAVRVRDVATGTTVGMGRVIGDGGWYFHLLDVAVLPEHQRRGIGDAILRSLLETIRVRAPSGAFVSALADVPARSLYERYGFVPTAPRSVGMAMTPSAGAPGGPGPSVHRRRAASSSSTPSGTRRSP